MTMPSISSRDQDAVEDLTDYLVEKRCLSRKTLRISGCSIKLMPKHGAALVLPYEDRDGKVGETQHKYRTRTKLIWSDAGFQPIFWRRSILRDPALQEEGKTLIITEGEPDAMSVIEAGYPYVVSVPNGAPKKVAEQIPTKDDDGRFAFIYEAMDDLRQIKDIVLATDDDPAGYALRDELIRRLGQARCRFVQYPEGCKDLNDVLMKFGPSRTISVAHKASAVPLAGVHRFRDYPRAPDPEPLSTGNSLIDGIFKPYQGELIVVTGIPGGGKSLFVNWAMARLVCEHGIKVGLGAYESYPPVRTLRFLMGACAGKDLQSMEHQEKVEWANFVDRSFVLIDNKGDPSSTARAEERFRTVDWFLAKCHDAMLRYGCQWFVVDPWNELEHAKARHESEHEYISKAIHKMRTFCEMTRSTIIIVAHPRKMDRDNKGQFEVPSLYDIAGSSAFFNRADHGLVVHRAVRNSPKVKLISEKVRHQPETGVVGDVTLVWDPRRMTYTSTTGD